MKSSNDLEGARFADQKDDPAANPFALDHLRNHPEISEQNTTRHPRPTFQATGLTLDESHCFLTCRFEAIAVHHSEGVLNHAGFLYPA